MKCYDFLWVTNLFHATDLYLYPMKTGNQRFCDAFRECRKRLVTGNGLITSKDTLKGIFSNVEFICSDGFQSYSF